MALSKSSTDLVIAHKTALQLKSLASISDEHAIKITKNRNANTRYNYNGRRLPNNDITYVVRRENEIIKVVKYFGTNYLDTDFFQAICAISVLEIDQYREWGYNVGWKKYTAQDLTDMGIVVEEKQN